MTDATDKPPFSPWAHDHTELVHVLWGAGIKGVEADALASKIMQSDWLAAQQRKAAIDALSDEALVADHGLVTKEAHAKVVALNEEIAEKLNFIGKGCYDASQEELVRRITAVGHEEYKSGDWLTQRLAPLRDRNSSLEWAFRDLLEVYRAEQTGTPIVDPAAEVARILAEVAADARLKAPTAPTFNETLDRTQAHEGASGRGFPGRTNAR
ncbi:hypothetical protein GCM10025867_48970 (plasmid) [Frondihabitans sucicola]|uniref:DUF222 domain-containing protein n=1 Tax=Frondihabitans sucicola TaxID=1268041 RepID=A0ABN6Y6J7_9MICO|nr:hypothetical protein [Frondihabitans sucicola]BDZ52656.1 hypothetical protein GCM10025867_48970 [Frondihabitans sucicola]